MSEAENTQAAPAEGAKTKKPAPPAPKKPDYSRKTLKAMWRKKYKEKIRTNPEFAKTIFEGKSKRSADRKLAYRKRHSGKKTA